MSSIIKVYFVRHAKTDSSVEDDLIRPLTKEGKNDSKQVTEFLICKNISRVYSSPYKRAIDTIKDFTDIMDLKINIVEDFRERKVGTKVGEDFDNFAEKQWKNFDYKLVHGESLNEVQKRNIRALENILKNKSNGNIVVGTHGTALSTIINYYDKNFDHKEFQRIKGIMPFIVCISFDGTDLINIEEFIIN